MIEAAKPTILPCVGPACNAADFRVAQPRPMLAKYPLTTMLLVATACVNIVLAQLKIGFHTGSLLFSMGFAQIGLLSLWAVHGHGPRYLRWIILALSIPIMSLLQTGLSPNSYAIENVLLQFGIHTILVAGTAAVLSKLILDRSSSHVERSDLPRRQFYLRHLFALTTAVAVLTVVFRWIWADGREWLLIAVAISYLVAVGAIVCQRLIRTPHLRTATMLAAGILVGVLLETTDIVSFVFVADLSQSPNDSLPICVEQAIVYAVWLSVVSYDLRNAAVSAT